MRTNEESAFAEVRGVYLRDRRDFHRKKVRDKGGEVRGIFGGEEGKGMFGILQRISILASQTKHQFPQPYQILFLFTYEPGRVGGVGRVGERRGREESGLIKALRMAKEWKPLRIGERRERGGHARTKGRDGRGKEGEVRRKKGEGRRKEGGEKDRAKRKQEGRGK